MGLFGKNQPAPRPVAEWTPAEWGHLYTRVTAITLTVIEEYDASAESDASSNASQIPGTTRGQWLVANARSIEILRDILTESLEAHRLCQEGAQPSAQTFTAPSYPDDEQTRKVLSILADLYESLDRRASEEAPGLSRADPSTGTERDWGLAYAWFRRMLEARLAAFLD